MKTYHNTITLHSAFDNIKRKNHVLIVLRDTNGNFLLGAKPHFYPPGIFRFAGGGVEENESAKEAVYREFAEELGFVPKPKSLQLIAQIITRGEFKNEEYTNVTHLFSYFAAPTDTFTAGDDIAYLKVFTPDELRKLIARYQALSIESWSTDNDSTYNWHDYGEMYGFIHQVALEASK